MEWSGLVLLVVGWLLGLFSPAIIESISIKRKLEPIKKQVRIEFDELSRQLVCITFWCAKDTSNLNKELIAWCSEELRKLGSTDETQQIAESLECLLKKKPVQIEAINNRQAFKNFEGRSLKKYELPYTMAHSTFMHNFNIDTQAVIWEVANRIKLLNQEVDAVRQYMLMTFDESITGVNHTRIVNEIKSKYFFISKSCRVIVNVANKLS